MRRLICGSLLFCGLLINAQAPIVLTATNMPIAGDTLRYTNITLNSLGNYTQTGVNFNWNFAAVSSGTEGVRSFVSAITTPYALFFASFTGFAEKMPDITIGPAFGFTDYYNFYKKVTTPLNAYVADGVGMTFSSIPLPCYYTDKDELYIFPLSYPKYDSTTYKFTTPNNALVPFRYTSVGYRVTKIDGWGSVTTPYGTANCLRLVTTVHGIDSIKNNIIPIPIGYPTVTRSYQWLTTTSKIPYFEVSGNVIGNNFIPTTARYRGRKPFVETTGIGESTAAPSRIFVYPNPVADKMRLSHLDEGTELTIYNAEGQLLRTVKITAQSEETELNVADLPAGLYSLHFNNLEPGTAVKFIKE